MLTKIMMEFPVSSRCMSPLAGFFLFMKHESVKDTFQHFFYFFYFSIIVQVNTVNMQGLGKSCPVIWEKNNFLLGKCIFMLTCPMGKGIDKS